MLATTMTRKTISLSLPGDLAEKIDAWAEAEHTNRSSLVTAIIKAEQRRRFEAELDRAYRECAAEGLGDDIEFFFPAQAEAALADPG